MNYNLKKVMLELLKKEKKKKKRVGSYRHYS